ncbi:hypothetical protein Gotur_033842 [Gossypium turneri]
MGAEQALKRIPRIKFPRRHPKPSPSVDVGLLFPLKTSLLGKRVNCRDLDGSKTRYHRQRRLFTLLLFGFGWDEVLDLDLSFLKLGFCCCIGSISETQATRKDGGVIGNFIARSRLGSDVPAPPSNTAVGGKASLLPKRTPVSEREIEAILVSKIDLLTSRLSSS